MKKFLPFIIFILAFLSYQNSEACHAIALVNATSQAVTNGIQVTASSDSPTCGCNVYWLDVEVRCIGEPFNAAAFSPGYWGPLTTYPFFQSAQMNKPNCVVQQYPWVTIPFTGLCAGTTYQYRMRENHNGQVGPWTTTYTFTVPGTMPTLTATAAAANSTLCAGQCTNISATASGGCNLALSYSWSNGSTGTNINVCPAVTTTYTVTVTEACSNQSTTQSVTINVLPPPVAGTVTANPAAVCAGQTSTLTISGSAGLIQWQSAPSSTGPWTNVGGATTTTYTTPPLSATTCYRAELTGCGSPVYTSPVCVTVNPAPVLSVTPAAPSICAGQSTALTASGATTYTWSPATGLNTTTGASVSANPTATTTYTVTGTSNGCTATTTVTVTVNPAPPLTVTPANPSICGGGSSTLTASGATTYSWSPSTGLTGTGATVTASPTVTTTYTVTGTSAGCVSTATVTVTVANNATASVTPSAPVICLQGNTTLSASGANSWTWTPATGLSATTGATVTANPTITTTYTVLGDNGGGCTASTTVTVTVNPLPVVSVTPALPAICTGSSVSLTASGASTYTWSPAIGLSGTSGATVSASPASTTTYTVTGTSASGCTATSTVTVTVNPLPQISVTPSSPTICNGNSVTLTASGAGLGGTYNWSPSSGIVPNNAATVTANPSQTTTYTVIGQTAAGCTNTATATVNVTSNPVISVSPASPSVCSGDPVTLTATGAGTGGNYSWTPITGLSSQTGSSVTANPTTTTTYTVTGTNAGGCSGTTTTTVSVNTNPIITVTPNAPAICTGNSVALTANGGVNYSWSPANGLSASSGTTVTASPTATSTYTVTGIDANGCSGSATATVTVNPLPAVAINPNTPAICIGGSVQLCASGAATYNWGPSSGLSSTAGQCVAANPSSTTTYTVMGTDANGCVNAAQATVTVNPLPVIAITPAAPAICAGSSTPLTASGTGAGGSYTWTPAAGLNPANTASIVASPTATTTYTATGTDVNGCVGSASVTVTVNPLPVVSASAAPTAICQGQTSTLTGSGAVSYAWTGPVLSSSTGTSVGATPASTSTYSVTGTDANGCTASTTVSVTVNPIPNVTATANPNPVCIGQASTLTASGGTSYSWSNGASGSAISVSPIVTTLYTVTATGPGGCTNSTDVTVTVHDSLNVYAFGGTSICLGTSTQISATASGGNGGPYFYSWNPTNASTATTNVSPSATTTYLVTVSDNCGTPPVTDSVTIVVNPLPVVSFTNDLNGGCYPVTINFQNTSNSSFDCFWNFGDGNFDGNCNTAHTFEAPGVYPVVLTITDQNGCINQSAPTAITAYEYPSADFVFGPQPTTIVNPVIEFNSEISSSDVVQWYWEFDSLGTDDHQNSQFTFYESGTYPVTLTVWNQNGCQDTVTYNVIIEPDFTIFIPNAFTPNDDHMNDTWGPESVGLDEAGMFDMKIFDRWGEMIFATDDPYKKWNGVPMGRATPAPQDVYVYRIIVKDHLGKEHIYEGHVSLVR